MIIDFAHHVQDLPQLYGKKLLGRYITVILKEVA